MDEQTLDADRPIRGQVRCKGYQRISHGLYRVLKECPDALTRLVRELECWREVLPEEARFTHLTGAQLLGWQVPKLPEGSLRSPETRRDHAVRG